MFREGCNCAQAVLASCGQARGISREMAFRVAQGFGGGMCHGETCGALTGAIMVIGLKHTRLTPADGQERQQANQLVRRLVEEFRARNKSIICRNLLACDVSTPQGHDEFLKSGRRETVCAKMVHDAAQIVDELLAQGETKLSQSRDTHDLVRNAYAEVARKQSSCCRPKASCCDKKPYIVPDHPVPEAELGLSCGNPLAFGHINKGDVVLDLGSGAGKDVFLAAQKIGEAGKAIGIDMTPEMLALARRNAVKFFETTGLTNVEFREGQIEALPVGDASVDVVISNCVINLSPDKPKVFREVRRVLKPGGKMLVSDIVLNHSLPDEFKNDADMYTGCIAGALLREDYLQAIRDSGFTAVTVLSEHTYKSSCTGDDPITGGAIGALTGAAASVTILAVK